MALPQGRPQGVEDGGRVGEPHVVLVGPVADLAVPGRAHVVDVAAAPLHGQPVRAGGGRQGGDQVGCGSRVGGGRLGEQHSLVRAGGPPGGDDVAVALDDPLRRAVAGEQPPPARLRVRHGDVGRCLDGVLQPDDRGHVGGGGLSQDSGAWCVGDAGQRRRRRDGEGVLVAEEPVEVRDPDHHAEQVTALGRPAVRPAHQSPDQAATLVRRVGGHQVDLPGGERDRAGAVADPDLLVEQQGGGDHPVAVDDDRARTVAGVRVLHHQPVVDRVVGVATGREQRTDLLVVGRCARSQQQPAGQRHRLGRELQRLGGHRPSVPPKRPAVDNIPELSAGGRRIRRPRADKSRRGRCSRRRCRRWPRRRRRGRRGWRSW